MFRLISDNSGVTEMWSQSNNMENMFGSSINEIIKFMEHLFLDIKKGEKMKGSDFVFYYVDRLHFKCQIVEWLSLAKWLNVCLRTKWLWVRVQLKSLKPRNKFRM